METHIAIGIAYWLITGIVAGFVSGSMKAKCINDLKKGRYFRAGDCGIKELAGIAAGGVAAYVLTGFHYVGGSLWPLLMFPVWFGVELLFVRYFVRRYDCLQAVR
jgi:hypothetical protein